MVEIQEMQPEMQQQMGHLEKEVKKAKEERSRALQEIEEVKKIMLSQRNVIKDLMKHKASVEILEVEVEGARESEKKMLESLVSQTKQLEHTKISLEESKLEIRSLRDNIKVRESSASLRAAVPARDEIGYLRTELKSALEAEETSKKAMDDLALALKEVTTESTHVKKRLSKTQLELATIKAEAEISKEKLRTALEESKRLKMEAEGTFTAWMEKENGFLNCMKMLEEEIASLNQENSRLIDSRRVLRDEISKLRDIVKHAVNEATVVKEALEIARNENSQLKDTITEKDIAFQYIKQDYECLKVSEAAALVSVKELKGLLAATSSTDSSTTTNSFETASRQFEAAVVVDGARVCKTMAKFPSEHWRCDNPRVPKARRYSLGEPAELEGPMFDIGVSPDHSFTFVTDVFVDPRAHSSVDSDDMRTVIFKDFNQMEGTDHERDSPTRQKKRRQIIRRFGDLLKRGFTHHA